MLKSKSPIIKFIRLVQAVEWISVSFGLSQIFQNSVYISWSIIDMEKSNNNQKTNNKIRKKGQNERKASFAKGYTYVMKIEFR